MGQRFFATPPGRRVLFALLYVSEGAPMGFIFWALPTLLTQRGMNLADVTALSALLTLPWVLKFLVGPIVDIAVARGQLLRHWITACQLCSGLLLLPLLWLDWTTQFALLTAVLFAHGCFSATQDVAIDTLAIRTVPLEELGRINGWMQAGMLTGRAVVAGSAVLLAAAGFEALVIVGLVAAIWLPLLALWLARPDETASFAGEQRSAGFDWRGLLVWPMLAGGWIALTAGAGFEFFTVTAGPLLVDLGGNPAETSLLFAVFAPAGLAVGALAGGRACAAFGARATVAGGIALVAFIAATLISLRATGIVTAAWMWLPVLGSFYLCAGFLICSSYTLMMQLSRGNTAATRFALLMSATNACESWAAFVGGRLAGPLGYSGALAALVLASLLALPVLMLDWFRRQLRTAAQPS